MKKSTVKIQKNPIEQDVYDSVIKLCTKVMTSGYNGTGHDLAQRISTDVYEGLLPKQQRMIYSMLSEKPISTTEVARECGLKSKQVSSQLRQMSEVTTLIGCTNDGKKKFWYKLR